MKLPLLDDLHVHLRQGEMMQSVVPSISQGGVGRVLVMPNLTPPITTVSQAVEYRNNLSSLNPHVEYFMTLFLCPEISIQDLRIAKQNNVIGVKSYPKGVTTGSDKGVENYETYYPIFQEMEVLGLSLHLHGEVPNTCVLKAEELFLENLFKIHEKFPNLKIVLEHVTSQAAVNAVLACGKNVAATITVHHLDLVISDVVGNNVNFCKPVAKLESDRSALRKIVQSGNPKFFLGSDSAPHPITSKQKCIGCPAGIFTQPFVAQYLADCFHRLGALDKLKNFACEFGASFLGLPPRINTGEITLRETETFVPSLWAVGLQPGSGVHPYRAGERLMYSL